MIHKISSELTYAYHVASYIRVNIFDFQICISKLKIRRFDFYLGLLHKNNLKALNQGKLHVMFLTSNLVVTLPAILLPCLQSSGL